MDKVGVFKGKGIRRDDGSFAQFGEKDNGNLEVIVDVKIAFPDGERVRSIPFYISEKALPFTEERLRSMGWEGDWATLRGVDKNEVEIEVTVEEYEGKVRNKYQILTAGAGRFSVQKPIDPNMLAARVAAIKGSTGNSGPGPKAPF